MKRWLKLVNYEVNYFRASFIVVLLAVVVIQLGAVYFKCQSLLQQAKQLSDREFMGLNTALEQLLPWGVAESIYGWWMIVGIVFIVLYCFYLIFWIWYREWKGEHQTIYRTLLMPASRLHVYSAKFVTVLLFIGVFLSIAFFMPYVMTYMADYLLGGIGQIWDMHMAKTVVFGVKVLFMTTKEMTLAGLVIISLFFSTILLERSFGKKGLIAGIVLVGIGIVMCILPRVFYYQLWDSFFSWEIDRIFYSSIIILFILAQVLNGYLITKRVEV